MFGSFFETGCVYTDNADVLYNKFNVDDNTGSPPLYPDDNEYCAVARKDWKAVNCSGKHLVVCEGGLTLLDVDINLDFHVIDVSR